jgi:hypothetical protein
MENADFNLFLNKSLENTTSQTLFFFLLTNAHTSSLVNSDSVSNFLLSSDLKELFSGYKSKDYQILNQLLRQTFKNQPEGAYEAMIQNLSRSGMELSWVVEDDIFLNCNSELQAVDSVDQLSSCLSSVRKACLTLESSFISSDSANSGEQSLHNLGFKTIFGLNQLKSQYPLLAGEIEDVVDLYFDVYVNSNNYQKLNA